MAHTGLRVLILTTEYPATVGGLGAHVQELATGLARAGHSVEVRVSTIAAGESRPEPNVTVTPVAPSYIPKILSGAEFLRQLESFNNDLFEHGKAQLDKGAPAPDVVHCHEGFLFQAARRLGELYGAPVVGTLHLLAEPCSRWFGMPTIPPLVAFERALCDGVHRLITVSQSMQGLIETVHPQARGRIRVVYNGLDVSLFQRKEALAAETEALRARLVEPGERVVIFGGRLIQQKGVTALLESSLRVAARVPKVKYLIAGTSFPMPEVPEITGFLEAHPEMKSRVKFLGKLPREQLAALYSLASLAVVPSLYEPFGYAAVEAMAAGVPVVASNAGGLAEIIQHEETGLLVPVHSREDERREVDVEQLTSAQVRLLEDEALARRLGEHGRRSVEGRFSQERMARETVEVYRETIASMAKA